MAKRNRRTSSRPAENGADFITGEAGPVLFAAPMPPVKSRGHLIPLFDWAEPSPVLASAPAERALVPSGAEVAALPRGARAALALRCAARAAHPDATTPDAVAARLVAAATTRTPLRRQLLCVRRDFDRLARLAVEQHWTDDTPVSQDVFGPLWPADLAPKWAKEPV